MSHAEREGEYQSRLDAYLEQERQEDRYETEKRFSVDLSIQEIYLLEADLLNTIQESKRELQQARQSKGNLDSDSIEALDHYLAGAEPLLARIQAIIREEGKLQDNLRDPR